MLEPIDKAFLLLIFLGVVYFYTKKGISNFKINRFKKNASKSDINILHSLEEQGYNIVDICSPKKIVYLKESKGQVDFLDSKIVVKNQGRKYLVEKYSPSETISLRDSFIKLKIVSNFICYHISGVLFINSKGEAIRECSLKIQTQHKLLYILKRGILFLLFTFLGFYVSRTFL